jgi:DNA-binding PadR family transcriptional regulator
MLVLQTLQWGAQHRYAIGNASRANSGEVLRVETGSFHPALYRLEKQGWVASEWKPTEAGQGAKFYRRQPRASASLPANATVGRSSPPPSPGP